ncbi:S-adenosylmethionine:tRNA ribosyltransferase-isomerase [Nocardia tenerifensis]|uniref:S-adenosylmethionine:tRNA ribosyltransferase-isomerase n=1 Tax=Nocardia tenerifensis TaxID=228006 RepID=A0A318KE20_9NOCA|nr:S-adenosylmethionine:tRNA ribosyltransferase-isomerase [Nocardia tenerifensis]PXX64221.1 S-adenosylmethionine:tRNA ribosyltransferase-isomerase [Nocardia tenerifensis]
MTVTLARRSFVLPPERNAVAPPEARGLARDEVRLLVAGDGLTHARFRELPAHLRPGDLVVVNNSATLAAAVDGRMADGPIALHFATWLDDGGWVVEVRTTTRTPYPTDELSAGTTIRLPEGARATLREPWLPGGRRLWIADLTVDPRRLLEVYGYPITYSYVPQRWSASYHSTVFGRIPGSAEMPSAARPFTERLVLDLIAAGVGLAPITLHTGVSSPEAGEPPSPERFVVPDSTARAVNDAKAAGGRVIAVGTTVTRALESAADPAGRVHAASGWTELVLGADHPARAVDGLITGWHAPGASHLDLLVAVAGEATVHEAYSAALDTGYLWHEFGDSALLLRGR